MPATSERLEELKPPPPPRSRRWMAKVMAAVLAISLLAWYFARPALPREIRIAAAAPHGLYSEFARALGEKITKKTGRPVQLIETSGSVENRTLLTDGKADLALIQYGAVALDNLSSLAPLFNEAVCFVARKGRGISSIRDMENKNISLGPSGSGMRKSALDVLAHYKVDAATLKQTDHYFETLLTDESLDGAIVTTGITSPDLHKVLSSGKFELLPMLDADALAVRYPYFTAITVPRGLFSEGPPVPPEAVPTVASTAILAVREGASSLLVNSALEGLYESDLSTKYSIMIPQKQAAAWPLAHIHSAARSYFDPYTGLNIISNLLQSLAAFKEMLFAIGAGLYLIWDRKRRKQEEASKAEMYRQKEHLDDLLNQTVRIERAQMGTSDPKKLREYLDQVTQVKLKALEELTNEDLRGDRMFSIFLAQCANLISKLQFKIQAANTTQTDSMFTEREK